LLVPLLRFLLPRVRRFPLRRCQTTSRCRTRVTPGPTTSPEVHCAPEYYEWLEYRPTGLTDPDLASSFRTSFFGFSRATGHRPCWRAISSSLALRSSPEYLAPSSPLGLTARGASLEVSSLFATSAVRVHCCERPTSRSVPPSPFLTTSAVCSAGNLAGLFHPATASRVPSSGVSPLVESSGLVARPLPSCRFRSISALV
jgi:hypothetical protein